MEEPQARQCRRVRAATLLELVAASFIIAFLTLGAAVVFRAGESVHHSARWYSKFEADGRHSLVLVTRALRHAYGVVSSTTVFGGTQTSSATQAIVTVPEASGVSPSTVTIRFYVTGNMLYGQRSDEAAPGKKFAENVSSIAFTYWQTVSGTRSDTTGTPANANEVELKINFSNANVGTSIAASTMLRNKLAGSL